MTPVSTSLRAFPAASGDHNSGTVYMDRAAGKVPRPRALILAAGSVGLYFTIEASKATTNRPTIAMK